MHRRRLMAVLVTFALAAGLAGLPSLASAAPGRATAGRAAGRGRQEGAGRRGHRRRGRFHETWTRARRASTC